MLCGDDDCTVLTSPDCNPVRRHPRFQNLYAYIRNSEGAVKLNGRPAGCHLTCELRKGWLADPSGKTPANCPLQGDVSLCLAWRLRHDGGYSNLAYFFFLYSTIYNVFFFFCCSIICVRILFFLPFRMFVDSLNYFKCKKDWLFRDLYKIIIITLDICYPYRCKYIFNIYLFKFPILNFSYVSWNNLIRLQSSCISFLNSESSLRRTFSTRIAKDHIVHQWFTQFEIFNHKSFISSIQSRSSYAYKRVSKGAVWVDISVRIVEGHRPKGRSVVILVRLQRPRSLTEVVNFMVNRGGGAGHVQ